MHAKFSQSRHLLLGGAALTMGMQFIVTDAVANPAGLSVAAGSATAQASGSKLTITTGNNAVLNWQSFNIAAGETTVFDMPSAGSYVVNNIHDANASQIYGSLQANGLVILVNPNGFYFGPNSFVSVGGLVLSTANCAPPQNAGGSWEFNGPPPLASIINYGQIQTAAGGSLYLIADQVENHGTLEAPGGSIGLAAGQTVLLTERPDGRGMSMAVTLPQGSVNNYGNVIADGGTLALNAQVVNQNGLLQANSVREENGQIELVAADAVNLGASSQISAQGDGSAGGSPGGNVTIQAGNTFSDAPGSQIVTAGGTQGGNGGNVEVSAPEILSLNSSIDAGAQNGGSEGAFILDPENITLGTTGSTSGGTTGTINGSTGSSTLSVNVNTAFKNITSGSILLEASGNITLTTVWNLSTSTGQTTGQLTLEAGQNIIFNSGSSLTDANNWGITLAAGYNFTTHAITSSAGDILLNGGLNTGTGTSNDGSGTLSTATGAISLMAGGVIQLGSGSVTSSGGNIQWQAGSDITFYDNNSHVTDGNGGSVTLQAGYNFASPATAATAGNIYVGGPASSKGGYLKTDSGNISLSAGLNIMVGSGYVTTTAGGSIAATADTGSINTGRDAAGYVFNTRGNATSLGTAYSPGSTLGGISTAAGGNVSLTAGQNVTSYLPQLGNAILALTAGAGAFGPEAGNVTVIAGGDVTGNYMVANGTGNIYAGVQFSGGNPIPNGLGGYLLKAPLSGGDAGSAGGSDPTNPSLALSLVAGGWNVAAAQNILLQEVRNPNGDFDKTAGAAYKYLFDYSASAFVDLSAGDEVQLGADTLPRISSQGSIANADDVQVIYPPILNITAGAGGVVLGTENSLYTSLTLFPSPAGSLTLSTSGQLSTDLPAGGQFGLVVSDSGNSQYVASDSNPAGNFTKSSDAVTPVHLNSPTPIYLNIGGDMDLISLTVPEAATVTVGGDMTDCSFQGMNLSAAPGFTTTVPEANGTSQVLPVSTATTSITVAGDIFEPSDYDAASGSLTTTLAGFALGGGGTFAITARSLDLGTSGGIESAGAALYAVNGSYPLAMLFGQGGAFQSGANLVITTTGNHTEPNTSNGDLAGDLDLTLSSLDSLFGGSITLNVGGDLNAGAPGLTVNNQSARGIYTTSGGDLSIIANGNINVNGSRLATYNGGNLTVESLTGSVDAGAGSSSPVSITSYYEDPATHTISSFSPQIPFSGLLTLTLPPSPSFPAPNATLGNILVETPNGGITADSSGILQASLSGATFPDALVTLLAGYELLDSAGNPATAADTSGTTEVFVSKNQSINLNGSGLLSSNAKLNASGDINGLIFALQNISLNSLQNIDVSALAGQGLSATAGGDTKGILTGGKDVDVSGESSASLISDNVSGTTTGQSGLGAGNVAGGTSQAAASDAATKAATATLSNDTETSDDKKNGRKIALAQKVSRVTVLLPGKK